jgi:hypothetical protein
MPTHHAGPPDEVAALDAYIKLMRAAGSVTARLEPVMGKGRELIQALFPRHVALVVREMAALSRREQALLGRLCRRVDRAARGSGKDYADGAAGNAVRLARAV